MFNNSKFESLYLFLGAILTLTNLSSCAKSGYIDYFAEKSRIKKQINEKYPDYLLKNQLPKETMDTLVLKEELLLDLSLDSSFLIQEDIIGKPTAVFYAGEGKIFDNSETKEVLNDLNLKIPIIIINKKDIKQKNFWQSVLHERAHQYFLENNLEKKGNKTFFKFYNLFKKEIFEKEIQETNKKYLKSEVSFWYKEKLKFSCERAKSNYNEFFAHLIAGQLGQETYGILKKEYPKIYGEYRIIRDKLTPLTEEKIDDSFILSDFP